MNQRPPLIDTRARYRRQQEMRRRRIRFYLLCTALVAVLVAVIGVSVSAVKNRGQETAADTAPTATPKPAPEFPPASEQNDLLKLAVEAKGSHEKVCYLTFDDGPTPSVTPQILEALRQYDAKATFFMLGSQIEENPDLARQVYEEGHLLANHSYTHEYDTLYATGESFMGEIERTEALIQEIAGEDNLKLIRFPGGSYNAGDHAAAKQEYKHLLQEHGYYYADWNCLNGDAEGGARSPEQLLSRIQETATQDNIVVLMHDAAAKKTTAEALPSILAYLQGEGYVFRRLDQVQYYEKEDNAASMIL